MGFSVWENEWWHTRLFILPNVSFWWRLNSFTHTHHQLIITNDLIVCYTLTNRQILDLPQNVHSGTHKTNLKAVQLQNRTRNVGTHSHWLKAQVSPITISSLTLLWLARGRAPLSWCSTYEKKTNVLRRPLRSELLFSLLWFIGSIVTSFLLVLNVPLICSARACTWNNSLNMNEKKAKHWGLWGGREQGTEKKGQK